jgi:hypothetical protein
MSDLRMRDRDVPVARAETAEERKARKARQALVNGSIYVGCVTIGAALAVGITGAIIAGVTPGNGWAYWRVGLFAGTIAGASAFVLGILFAGVSWLDRKL